MSQTEQCFIICPIGSEGTDIREHSNNVFEHVVQPPLRETGYEPIRADHIDEPGDITRQIIEQVYNSPLVIADLSYQNANVFYELAIRHAAKKPVIQIIQSGHELPFDIQNQRTIHYDLNDVPTNTEAQQDIIDQIRYIEEEGTYENPISETFRFQSFHTEDDPEQVSITEIQKGVSEIQSTVLSLENSIKKELHNSRKPPNNLDDNEFRELKNDLGHLTKTLADFGQLLENNDSDLEKLNHIYYDFNKVINRITSKFETQTSLEDHI